MTRNENQDDSSSRNGLKTRDNGGAASWSDLNHDVLFLVMMKLGVIHFVSFSGVYKSWRSLALSNKKKLLASSPPMSMRISNNYNYKECYCHLEDIEGRKFKTLLPNPDNRTFVGLTAGYLIFYGVKTRNLWLVNPITRHELYSPVLPFSEVYLLKAMLVFSPSTSGWILLVIRRFMPSISIWFSVVGKGLWDHVSSTFPICDIFAFKGKIYIINSGCCFHELRLNSNPKLTSAVKPPPLADHFAKYKAYASRSPFSTNSWYFPHDCVDNNLIDE